MTTWEKRYLRARDISVGDMVEFPDGAWRVTNVSNIIGFRETGEYVDLYGVQVDENNYVIDDTEQAFVVHYPADSLLTTIDI